MESTGEGMLGPGASGSSVHSKSRFQDCLGTMISTFSVWIKQEQQVQHLCTCTVPALRTQSTALSTARGEGAQPCFKVWSEQKEHPKRYGTMKNV